MNTSACRCCDNPGECISALCDIMNGCCRQTRGAEQTNRVDGIKVKLYLDDIGHKNVNYFSEVVIWWRQQFRSNQCVGV